MQMDRKRITIADIAREAGYSKTAVSFAFNAPERIGAAAREKILETARVLNYIPDQRARNFSLGRQLTLGFLLPQDLDICLANPYIVEVMRGLGKICQDHGYMLSIIPPINDSVYEAVKKATVDGLVTMGYLVSGGVGSLVDLMATPLVMIDGGKDENFLSVNIDEEKASFMQMERVLSLGHRRLAVVTLPAPTLTPKADDRGIVSRRLSGYRAALGKYDVPLSSVRFFNNTETTFDDGYRAGCEIMESGATCVVTMSDIQAYGIMHYLREHGVRVPQDISIIGFDNICPYRGEKKLTTVNQPAYEKGRIAALTMFDLLEGRTVESAPLVPFSIVEGETLCPPAN